MKDGIVIVFPGTGYPCKERLLVECSLKYSYLGYNIVNLDFSSVKYKEINTLKDAVEKTKQIILEQLKDIIFEEYNDIIFISKSLGTVCANWVEKYLNIVPRQLYLTPLQETIETINQTSRIIGMVIGTEDRHLDYRMMELFCIERNIPYLVFNDVGHNLKIDGDELKTEDMIIKIVKFCNINL